MQGKVKFFDNDRGFGFIVSEGKEYFVHFSEVNTSAEEFKTLNSGDRVNFEAGTSPKGAVARQVTVEGPDNPQYINRE